MDDYDLQRLSRHILLDEFGLEGQRRVLESHVAVVGLGGLGCPAALYLAVSGVGKLTLIDPDVVDLTNLQRQVLHTQDRIGEPKVLSAQKTIQERTSRTVVLPKVDRLTPDNAEDLFSDVTLVLDCSDNFATRHLINRTCYRLRKPLVSGAAVRFSGQLSVFDFGAPNQPCYHCLFPEEGEVEEMRCALMGVFSPLTGVIGSLQACEAIKLLAGIGPRPPSGGELILFDALQEGFRKIKFSRDPACPVCGIPAYV